MKTRGLLAIALFAFLGASTATAQDSTVHVGIGVSIDPPRLFISSGSSFYSNVVTPVNVYVPIGSAHFRVEPDFGFYSYTYESTVSGTSEENDASIVHIGLGAFYIISSGSPTRVYLGPRLGLNFVSMKSSSSYLSIASSSEVSETDFTIGLAVGGEHMLSPQFSVGGEAQLNYIIFGQPTETQTSGGMPAQSNASNSVDVTRHLFATNVLFFFRWYF
ncbi:MAG TPA: outer membrane beta-barrel protein [Bacteroidota bacterium]|nr:outer membrane beta-barrel protein [Bacteroidota bacterium]